MDNRAKKWSPCVIGFCFLLGFSVVVSNDRVHLIPNLIFFAPICIIQLLPFFILQQIINKKQSQYGFANTNFIVGLTTALLSLSYIAMYSTIADSNDGQAIFYIGSWLFYGGVTAIIIGYTVTYIFKNNNEIKNQKGGI